MTLYFAMLLFLFPTNNIKNQKKRNPPGKDSCGMVKTVPYKPHQSGAMRPAGQHTGKLLTPNLQFQPFRFLQPQHDVHALYGGTGAAFAKVVQQADEQHPLAVGGNSGVNFKVSLPASVLAGRNLGAVPKACTLIMVSPA